MREKGWTQSRISLPCPEQHPEAEKAGVNQTFLELQKELLEEKEFSRTAIFLGLHSQSQTSQWETPLACLVFSWLAPMGPF